MPIIKALRTTITDGTQDFPIFLGFLTAAELESIAEVPSFTENSENFEIANNILGDPVKGWQRPPIVDKVEKIRERFSRTAEIMPNPVLLAVNDKSLVTVSQQELSGQSTGLYEIDVKAPGSAGARPLWILDGQHRVLGLAKSERSGNAVPLVLLHNDAVNAYAPKQFAKIFAEVTTLATPLHQVHNEWLQFAFKLDAYSSKTTADWLSMKAVADLCRTQEFGDPATTNPFFDRIEFNPVRGGGPAIDNGFQFNCIELKDLIRSQYYGQPSAGSALLEPPQLAEQLALALVALAQSDTTTRKRSAFFGESKARQKYMEEAFVTGVLAFLGTRGLPPDGWKKLLSELAFTSANWDFTGWVVTTGGNTGTLSKKVANNTFIDIFSRGSLPHGVDDIPTYLRGDSARLSFQSSGLTPSGQPRRPGRAKHDLPVSGVKKLDLAGRRHLKLTETTANVGQLEIRDSKDTFSEQFSMRALRKGVVLPDGGGRIELQIQASMYGGTKQPPLTLEVVWS